VNFGASYLDATFARDATIVNTVTNAPQLVHQGDDLPFSPRYTFNVGVQYALTFDRLQITPRLQWAYEAAQIATPFPSFVTEVPAHGVADARVAFDWTERYHIKAFVDTFTNKLYIA